MKVSKNNQNFEIASKLLKKKKGKNDEKIPQKCFITYRFFIFDF